MNKTTTIFNALTVILLAAVIVLFVLVIKKPKCAQAEACNPSTTVEMNNLPVAYINVDSLLLQYDFAINANDALMRKQEDARLRINTQAKRLQEDMNDFQRKLENNAFLSRTRAEQEQTRLLQKQEELQKLDAQLTEELMVEQQNMSLQLRDSINNILKVYNADNRYQLIISNTSGDNLLYASEAYNITNDVVELLNTRCKK
ncbi:MAG: OmpH family outer membrane protein [Paludibacteraceae bacterium]|nr:OmpH family outer membrane protein [Paludibacteraceae bacterium]MBO7258654.1 OmpH family outer membrane protein [Paludibacteraceae bacterium]